MEAEGILTALAEVAIAIAGFSGIVVVLDRSDQPWSELDRARFTMLLQISLSCVFWSFFPILLHLAEVPPASIWFWSSASWLIYMLISLGSRIRQRPRSERLFDDPSVKAVLAFMFVGLAISVSVQVANVGWLRAPWPYVLAVLQGLLVACTFFVRLLRRFTKPAV